ncbi:MAG: hypothetical protein ACTSXP_00655 [Promethearchaeota archaeon]
MDGVFRQSRRKWLFMIAITIVVINCISSTVILTIFHRTKPAVFYVDFSLGNDKNNGNTPARAWKTISKVNSGYYLPGDKILFKRGEVWREKLEIKCSGSETIPITYGAYGSGPNPLFLGSISKNKQDDWIYLGNEKWATRDKSFPNDVGFIMLEEEDQSNTGIKCMTSCDEVNSPRRFWYDNEHERVVLYCSNNPANQYSSIEIAYSDGELRHIIQGSHVSNIVIQNLSIKYFNAHRMQFSSVQGIIIKNCEISFGGGQIQHDSVRYGNGIEFWENARDCVVESCIIGEIYDAAVTNQGNGFNKQHNITYSNNILWNSEYLYEYWNRPENSSTKGIYFINNICINAGYGLGHDQRPDPSGHTLSFHSNLASIQNFNINYNLFIRATGCIFYLSPTWGDLMELDSNYNYYYQPSGTVINFQGTNYDASDFTEYQAVTGKDLDSILVDDTTLDDVLQDRAGSEENLEFINSILNSY